MISQFFHSDSFFCGPLHFQVVDRGARGATVNFTREFPHFSELHVIFHELFIQNNCSDLQIDNNSPNSQLQHSGKISQKNLIFVSPCRHSRIVRDPESFQNIVKSSLSRLEDSLSSRTKESVLVLGTTTHQPKTDRRNSQRGEKRFSLK